MKGVATLIRGAYAQFKFKLPYEFDNLTTVEVTFQQKQSDGTTETITKNKTHCESVSGQPKVVYVTLDQSETLQFTADKKVQVQLRALTDDGIVFASHIKQVTIYPTLSTTELE